MHLRLLTDLSQDENQWGGYSPGCSANQTRSWPRPAGNFGPWTQGSQRTGYGRGQFGQSMMPRIRDLHRVSIHQWHGQALPSARMGPWSTPSWSGVGTALADGHAMDVRRVAWPKPCTLVLDHHRRLPRRARLFAEDGIRRIAITRRDTYKRASGVETIALPGRIRNTCACCYSRRACGTRLSPDPDRGRRHTVSRLLRSGLSDRLPRCDRPDHHRGGRRISVHCPHRTASMKTSAKKVNAHSLSGSVADCDPELCESRVGLRPRRGEIST